MLCFIQATKFQTDFVEFCIDCSELKRKAVPGHVADRLTRHQPTRQRLWSSQGVFMSAKRLLTQGPRRGMGWGALAPPLFCKNKNKLNK